jgi:hypothetical protein
MPFQPGQSGNPAGRPRGARNKATILLETLLESDGEALMRQFVEQAKAGNARALGYLMAMILPKRKGAPIEIDLPPLEKASDAPVAIAAVISAVCMGELTPEEGILLTRLVEAFLRVKQKVEKLGRKAQRVADDAAAERAKAAEPHVSRQGEAAPPNPAVLEADAPRQAGESSGHSPRAQALRALPEEAIPRGYLPRLRQEALRSTSALAHGARIRARIVSPLLITSVSCATGEEPRAA